MFFFVSCSGFTLGIAGVGGGMRILTVFCKYREYRRVGIVVRGR